MTVVRTMAAYGMWFGLVGATSAAADTIDISGTWGNKTGCEWAREIYENDDGVILTKDGIEGSEYQCKFIEVRQRSDKSFVSKTTCFGEGTEETHDVVISAESAGKTRMITFSNGAKLGPVSRC